MHFIRTKSFQISEWYRPSFLALQEEKAALAGEMAAERTLLNCLGHIDKTKKDTSPSTEDLTELLNYVTDLEKVG